MVNVNFNYYIITLKVYLTDFNFFTTICYLLLCVVVYNNFETVVVSPYTFSTRVFIILHIYINPC